MIFPPDLIEKKISNIDQAWALLNSEIPEFHNLFNLWKQWYLKITHGSKLQNLVINVVVICYARMALRNGTLANISRCYHSEKHIDDLIYRLMAISNLPAAEEFPNYGWSLLSIFMSGHDIRQDESNNALELVGNNERASFDEVLRLINQIDSQNVFRSEHKELLKLMIHGSTFGQGEDNNGNIFKGNLVDQLLKKVGYFDPLDKEIALLACDIDTANVASNLSNFATSSMNVYNEIQKFSKNKISARLFFGQLQEQYFFELQKFNSRIGYSAFAKQKESNAPKIQNICNQIKGLDISMPNQCVIDRYLKLITKLS